MTVANLLAPIDRIDQLGVQKLREHYSRVCPGPEQTRKSLEISAYFMASNMSAPKFADVVELSKDQVTRLVKKPSSIKAKSMDLVIQKLKLYFPFSIDSDAIEKEKVKLIIESIHPQLTTSNQEGGINSAQVADLTKVIEPPSSEEMTCSKKYDDWIQKVRSNHSGIRRIDIDASGCFFAARELLEGFQEKIFSSAYSAAKATDSPIGNEVFEAIGIILVALSSTRQLRNSGAKKIGQSERSAIDVQFNRWHLSTGHTQCITCNSLCSALQLLGFNESDLLSDKATVAYLLMRSRFREKALKIIQSEHETGESNA